MVKRIVAVILLVGVASLGTPTVANADAPYFNFVLRADGTVSGCVSGASQAQIDDISAALGGSRPSWTLPNPSGGIDGCWDDLPPSGPGRSAERLLMAAKAAGLTFREGTGLNGTANMVTSHADWVDIRPSGFIFEGWSFQVVVTRTDYGPSCGTFACSPYIDYDRSTVCSGSTCVLATARSWVGLGQTGDGASFSASVRITTPNGTSVPAKTETTWAEHWC
jgi:hypothetical protein